MGTRRQEIVALLSQEDSTVRELAERFEVKIAVIVEDLTHIHRSLGNRLVVGRAHCETCGFSVGRETRFTAPSRCPRCKSERVTDPEIRVDE